MCVILFTVSQFWANVWMVDHWPVQCVGHGSCVVGVAEALVYEEGVRGRIGSMRTA